MPVAAPSSSRAASSSPPSAAILGLLLRFGRPAGRLAGDELRATTFPGTHTHRHGDPGAETIRLAAHTSRAVAQRAARRPPPSPPRSSRAGSMQRRGRPGRGTSAQSPPRPPRPRSRRPRRATSADGGARCRASSTAARLASASDRMGEGVRTPRTSSAAVVEFARERRHLRLAALHPELADEGADRLRRGWRSPGRRRTASSELGALALRRSTEVSSLAPSPSPGQPGGVGRGSRGDVVVARPLRLGVLTGGGQHLGQVARLAPRLTARARPRPSRRSAVVLARSSAAAPRSSRTKSPAVGVERSRTRACNRRGQRMTRDI